jgi:hypothetical protein
VPRCQASTPRWSARSRSGPCWAPWPPSAHRHGITSCSSCPSRPVSGPQPWRR